MRWFRALRETVRGGEVQRARRRFVPSTESNRLEPRLLMSSATDRTGAYRVDVWTKVEGNQNVIRGRVFVGDKKVADNVLIHTTPKSKQYLRLSVAVNHGGRFAVAWDKKLTTTVDWVWMRVFDNTSHPLTAPISVDNTQKSKADSRVDINDDGLVVVSYTLVKSKNNGDIRARSFKPTDRTGTGYDSTAWGIAEGPKYEFDSSVKVAENGHWAVSYTQYPGIGGSTDVKAVTVTKIGKIVHIVAMSAKSEYISSITTYDENVLAIAYRKNKKTYTKYITSAI